VPIFAELRPYLEAAFEAAPDGALNVITRRRASAQRWGIRLERILARAGIDRWERIFHNLRASRQTELTAVYSIGTVCRWLGNSVEVADAHYLTALESEFERAARSARRDKNGAESGAAKRSKRRRTAANQYTKPRKNSGNSGNAKKHPEACKSQGDTEHYRGSLRKTTKPGETLQKAVHSIIFGPLDDDELELRALTLAAHRQGNVE
jgi:hypothetical protein